ncbi:MAG: S9 family peptidase [Thermoanaerobaculia bacterium]
MQRPTPRSFRPVQLAIPFVLAVALLQGGPAGAQETGAAAEPALEPVYRTPAQVLVDMVDAPPSPEVALAPGKDWLLVLERPSLPPIEELARRELRLAGLRIDPATHGRSRTYPLSGLRLVRLADGEERQVRGLPAEPRIGDPTFSPDGSRVAFTHTGEDGIELWVLEVASGEARRLTDPAVDALNLAAGHDPAWLPDSRSLIVPLVVQDDGPEPEDVPVPTGPVIQETADREAPARTYQDLLEDAHDQALFEHYLAARLARVDLDGSVDRLGEPGILWSFDPSPDGRYLLTEWLHRPFSYLVPASRFPRRVEVWGADGALVRRVADLPLQEEVPIAFGSVPTGPRSHHWRADADATLAWTEALDGGDASAEADERDRVFLLPEPFDGEPQPLVTLPLRFGGVQWGDGDLALVEEWWWPTRRRGAWRVHPEAAEAGEAPEPEKVLDYSWEDRYKDPGDPVTEPDDRGRRLLATSGDGETLFFIGDGASPEGDRPFLDALDLSSGETERLFHSQAPYYERPVAVLDGEGRELLVRRESTAEPPNHYVWSQEGSDEHGLRQVTHFPHPTPQLEGVHKELIRYTRDDGVELTGTLYLPPGHEPGDGPLPTLLWAYPIEFKSTAAASQVTDSPYRFVRVGWYSPLLFLARGYAVLDDPGMPIVGEGDEEPNDTYVEQLVASAEAAVDAVVERGVAERGRIAIGGHSYGAFMAANLLAHSDLFAAGIARSGAYNRTLTPFGFQAEERTVWEAPEVYVAMSPFMHAEKVDEPILLIHGDSDNNSGTYPMQSERFYSALKGLGGTARLVMLPLESHGYRARESVLHALWEMDRWLERWVKEAPPAETSAP